MIPHDPRTFRVESRRIGTVAVVVPDGELDGGTAPLLVAETTRALSTAPAVVVDLSSVSFLDCRALGVLVSLTRRARERGGRLRVAALPGHAHDLFSRFDLYGVLGGRSDVAGECRALAALADGAGLAAGDAERPRITA
ncbi:STAS domain-containing protein [Kineococcus gypseus]|uniref:STAS domain-containing protein n=1 Tax=Kineococcus gypseus TaxID=1637102 RepID=UPI003D7C5499